MVTPTPKETEKVQDKIKAYFKKLNPDGSPKRAFDDNLAKALFRSAVREKWMYSPTKLSFLLSRRIPDTDDSTRTKWLHRCQKCGKLFKESEVNVDHRFGENEFREWSQAQQWASKILDVKHEDLQILCIPDHATKSRCEALGLNWETEEGWRQGLLEQEYTKVCDLKAKAQSQWLIDKGVVPGKNEETRKVQIREIIFSQQEVLDNENTIPSSNTP